jgi:hypothetical protein
VSFLQTQMSERLSNAFLDRKFVIHCHDNLLCRSADFARSERLASPVRELE